MGFILRDFMNAGEVVSSPAFLFRDDKRQELKLI
jgi:hypothetical protein